MTEPVKQPPRPAADATGGPAYVLERQIGYLLRRAHQRASARFATPSLFHKISLGG